MGKNGLTQRIEILIADYCLFFLGDSWKAKYKSWESYLNLVVQNEQSFCREYAPFIGILSMPVSFASSLIPHKWNLTLFAFLCLAFPFKIMWQSLSHHCIYWQFVVFYRCAMSLCMDLLPEFSYHFSCRWTFGLFMVLGIRN